MDRLSFSHWPEGQKNHDQHACFALGGLQYELASAPMTASGACHAAIERTGLWATDTDYFGDIWIMNLRTERDQNGKRGYAQDQLVSALDYTPAPPSSVHPEPLSVIVWTFLGATIWGLSLFRRRK